MEIEKTKLPTSEEMEAEGMEAITCPSCKWPITVECERTGRGSGIKLEGILTCSHSQCNGHSWPIVIEDNRLVYTESSMPTRATVRLSEGVVPVGLLDDLKEAERAHFSQCYKGTVVICRRILQLALEDKDAKGRTLGPLLDNARAMKPPLLSKRADTLAEGIKDYGDGGAHREEPIDRQDAAMMIHVTAMILNELYPISLTEDEDLPF